jgi:hypothetical protein
MNENLFLVAIQGRANESYYQLDLPQIGRQAATAIRACLLHLYRTMGGSSIADIECAFTLGVLMTWTKLELTFRSG